MELRKRDKPRNGKALRIGVMGAPKHFVPSAAAWLTVADC